MRVEYAFQRHAIVSLTRRSAHEYGFVWIFMMAISFKALFTESQMAGTKQNAIETRHAWRDLSANPHTSRMLAKHSVNAADLAGLWR
jgi:hypothetical protein